MKQENRDFTTSVTPRLAPLGRTGKNLKKFEKSTFQLKRSNILGSKTPKTLLFLPGQLIQTIPRP